MGIKSEHIFSGRGLIFKSNSTNINVDEMMISLEQKKASMAATQNYR